VRTQVQIRARLALDMWREAQAEAVNKPSPHSIRHGWISPVSLLQSPDSCISTPGNRQQTSATWWALGGGRSSVTWHRLRTAGTGESVILTPHTYGLFSLTILVLFSFSSPDTGADLAFVQDGLGHANI